MTSYGVGPTNTPFLGQTGNLGGQPEPASYSNTSNPFSPYFGEPLRDISKELNPYSKYGRENYALPDAYKGGNQYMTQVLIHVIQNEDLWPTRVVLPIRVTESEMEIQWDEYVFNNHLLGPVPEEGVSRLVTQTTNERRDHYVRYGIAFILEHGFMKTQKGQTSYRMNLEQIRNATLESMYFGVIEALLKSKQYSQAWIRKYGTQSRSGSALRGILGEEVERYFCIQKSEYGFDLLDNKAKKYLRSNGVTPNTWIVPEGMFSYLALVRPENRDYLLKGPQGPADYNSALQVGTPALQTRNGCQVFESKSFEIPNAPGPIDPMNREVSVGEHVTMLDTVSDIVAPSDYKSFMRDIFIYNEARDDFSRINLRQALAGCGRFTSSGDELYFPAEFGMTSSNVSDMFLMNYPKRPAFVFGDMESEYLSTDTLIKLGTSVASKLKGINTAEIVSSAGELWSKVADKAEKQKALDTLLAEIKNVLPTSRVFGDDYQPEWHTDPGNKATHGFFINTIGKTEYAYRVPSAAGGVYQAPADVTKTASPINLFNYKVGNVDHSVFAEDGKIDGEFGSNKWAAIRDVLYQLVSTKDNMEDVSLAEKALNNSSVDKILHRLQGFSDILMKSDLLAVYLSLLDKLRKNAIAGDYVKHFAYVVHKLYDDFSKEVDFSFGKETALLALLLTNGVTDNGSVIDYKTSIESSAEKVRAYLATARAQTKTNYSNVADADAKSKPSDTFEILPTRIGSDTMHKLNAYYREHVSGPIAKRMRRAPEQERFGAYRTADHEPAGYWTKDGGDGYGAGEDPTKVDSQNMKTRFDEIFSMDGLDVVVKAAILTFLHTPITNKALQTLIEKDVFFPFEFILFRPQITHNMSTAVLMKAGAETGETLVGHADFQLADDVVRKLHYGNFTLYSKSIVYKSDNVYLAENIMATGYVRGNDVSINTLTSLRNEMEAKRSIYVAMVPINDTMSDDTPGAGGLCNPMDVTGAFAANVPHMQNLDAEIGNNRGSKHYPTADFYAMLYQFNNSTQQATAEYEYEQVNRYNTLTFAGHQMTYNPNTKLYDCVSINTGHFGSRIYPGCGRVRRGESKYLEAVAYGSEFGGKTSLTTVGV